MVCGLAVVVVLPLVVTGQQETLDYDSRFTFTRIRDGSGFGRGGGSWAHDYPRADEHLPKIIAELSTMRPRVDGSNVLDLEDPAIFHNPILYISEPGFWSVTEDGAANLRAHLLKGGFLIFDDFRGGGEWANLDLQMSRAFPEGRWVDLDASHPIFHSFFEINSLDIVPQAYDQGRPIFRGLFQDNDPNKRLMAVTSFQSDMSEFWEWSDTGYAPIEANNEAYKLGINLFMYGITH